MTSHDLDRPAVKTPETDPSSRGARTPPERLDAASAALFLDLDGTLAPIVATPDEVGPDARRTRLLRALGQALGGRLAVISGRTLADIDRILDGAVTAASGVHGLERRTADGVVRRAEPSAALPRARQTLEVLARAWPGVMLEDKGLSLAVHYRNRPEAAEAVREAATAAAAEGGLLVQHGRKVAELRPPGPDKGAALTAFMAEPPFAGATPFFVGDDLTDEAGFAAAAALGGVGVLVGPERATGATHRLADIAAVYAWLEAALRGGGA
jgi:trehalose 6-phosphate phosphatase